MQLQAICGNVFGMSDEPGAEVIEVWTRFLRAHHAVLSRVEEDLKRAGFPPLEWYDVLLELDRAEAGWLRQSDVVQRVLLAPYNLSRLVDRLEREGLVERRQCPMDGRNNVLMITGKGRELRGRMWPAYAAAIATHLGRRLDPAETQALSQLLGRLVAEKPGVAAPT
jgi:DNA-binding MarR family transcriptional regulator